MSRKLSQEDSDALKAAAAKVAAARAHYNATWREHPTAKGFPLVDKALDALHEAEAELDALTKRLDEKYPRPAVAA